MMDIKVSEKKENPMLDRTEVSFDMSFSGAVPSRQEVSKKLAAGQSADENLVVIKKIETMHGYEKAKALAFVYKNEDAMKKVEYEFMLNRSKKKGEEAKTEEKPAEVKKAE